MHSIRDMLIENPVIAAVRSDGGLEKAVKSPMKIVFVLYGSLITLPGICRKLREASKTVFIHADMIEGLKGDFAGVQFIVQNAAPDGIVSTKANLLKYARSFHLETVLRVFLLDSLSLKTGIKNIRETNPDAVEIMPGVACSIIHEMESQIEVPVIAGGLIVKKEQVLDSLAKGAVAISTSEASLWDL